MSFLFINKTLRLNDIRTRTAMNAKMSVFVICVEAIVYLLLYNLRDFIFKVFLKVVLHPGSSNEFYFLNEKHPQKTILQITSTSLLNGIVSEKV